MPYEVELVQMLDSFIGLDYKRSTAGRGSEYVRLGVMFALL
jgi:hypothetical protein